MASDFYPGFYNRVSAINLISLQIRCKQICLSSDQLQLDMKNGESKALRARRSMVTRTNFYKIIERKLKAYVQPNLIYSKQKSTEFSSRNSIKLASATMDAIVYCVRFVKLPILHWEWIMAFWATFCTLF